MARIILRDGRIAELRPPQDTEWDREHLKRLFHESSPDSLYFRFFHMVSEISPKDLEQMMAIGREDSYALIAVAQDKILAIGDYAASGPQTAEVAFFVDDKMQGRGLGTLLLEQLAHQAWLRGVRQFEAFVLGENQRMITVFRSSGFEIHQEWTDGVLRLILPLGETERVRALQDTRDKLATAASLHTFFEPRTVAVIGASRDPHRLGHLVFRHILDDGFQGTVYPVNPSARSVASVRAYPSVSEIPEPLDLAVVVVPADGVMDVVKECIAAGAKGVVVTSSGFSETQDPERVALEYQMTQILRGAGIRLLGPNCLGLLNTQETVQLNASFAPRLPPRGPVAIASHSGALGIAILDYAGRLGVGVSSFASMGNKADVSGNDLLQYWEDDPATSMVVLYLESFGNPRKFSRIARRVTQHKPVLVVKSARSPEGDVPVDALFRQTGIIRANTLEELFDVVALLSQQPLPPGRRVGVVTNASAAAVITVDALEAAGLLVAGEPINLGFDALADGYRTTLPPLLRDPAVDAVIVLFIPVGVSDETAVSGAIAEVIAEYRREIPEDHAKPVVANFLMTDDTIFRYINAGASKIPVYRFPESAVHALAQAARYAEYRRQPQGRIIDLSGINPSEARAVAVAAMTQEHLDETSVGSQILLAMGISDLACQDLEGPIIHIKVSVDPLFGPLMSLHREYPQPAPQMDSTPAHILRIIPLTDLDALMMANRIVPNDLQPGLQNTLLRLSRLIEEVPEIASFDLDIASTPDRSWVCTRIGLTLSPAHGVLNG